MKIKHFITGAVSIVLLSLNSFAGSLVVANDYPEIGVENGGISGGSLNLNAKQFQTDSPIFLKFNPKNSLGASYNIFKINDFFAKKTGTHSVSKNIKGKNLEVSFEIDKTTCTKAKGEICFLQAYNIQDFRCTVLKVTFDGVELNKKSEQRKDL
jgi:hypothetical protein